MQLHLKHHHIPSFYNNRWQREREKIQLQKWACSFWFTWKSERNRIRNVSKNTCAEHNQLSSCKCLDGFWQRHWPSLLIFMYDTTLQPRNLSVMLSKQSTSPQPNYFWFLSQKSIFHHTHRLTEHMPICTWLIISALALGEMYTLLCLGGSFLFTDKISSILIAYHILFIVLLLQCAFGEMLKRSIFGYWLGICLTQWITLSEGMIVLMCQWLLIPSTGNVVDFHNVLYLLLVDD